MNRKLLFLCICPLMFLLVLAASPRASTQENAAQVRKIPGINAPDAFESACTSCHTNKPATNQDGRPQHGIEKCRLREQLPRIRQSAGSCS